MQKNELTLFLLTTCLTKNENVKLYLADILSTFYFTSNR